MCGIFGYIGTSDATTKVFEGLKNLEYRGYDSWGIACLDHGHIVLDKQVGKIGGSTPQLGASNIAIGHTRWATHGGVTVANSHPHLDCTGTLAVVHNGIIENFADLATRLAHQGHNFVSTTDTEVFAHLVEHYHHKLTFVAAVKRAFAEIRGFNTIVVMSKSGEIVACKNGSPLVVALSPKREIYLSSDLPSLLSYTNNLAIIGDGEFVHIKDAQLCTKLRFHKYPVTQVRGGKGSYSHYMLKEIYDQPGSLTNMLSLEKGILAKARALISSADSIYLLGCGSSYYAMLSAEYLLASHTSTHLVVQSASEFHSFARGVGERSVILIASQSGETMDTISAMRLAHARGARTIALTNVLGSTIARESTLTIDLNAGIEKAVVSTKAYTSMLAAVHLLVVGAASLKRGVTFVKKMLTPKFEKLLSGVVSDLYSAQHLYILGRGTSYPTALEAALKFKETSYLHAEGFASGELKHGVLALVEPGTLVIAIFASDPDYQDMLSAVMELKARGAKVIAVGPKSEPAFDTWIKVPDYAPLSGILNIIPLQLLSYHLSLSRGLDPDMPRNLAKSVTVK